MGIPSCLIRVDPLLRHVLILRKKPLTSTVPVHRRNRQAPRVFPGVFFRSTTKPVDPQPQDPLLFQGVVYEPLDQEQGTTRLERFRDRHLGSFRPLLWVHWSRRHHGVTAYPVW